MSASAGQRLWNLPPYHGPRQRVTLDTWYGLSKHEKSGYAALLTSIWHMDGGETKRPALSKSHGPGRPRIFQRDAGSTSTATYTRYFNGWRPSELAIIAAPDRSKSAYYNAGQDRAGARDTGAIGYIGPVKNVDGDLAPRNGRNLADDAAARIRDTAAMRAGEVIKRDEFVTKEMKAIATMRDPDGLTFSASDEWNPADEWREAA
jgi:hypothetical protein